MKKRLLWITLPVLLHAGLQAQQCLSSGFCSNITNQHQYPTTTYSTTSSSWTTVSAYMNADNYTLFLVTAGDTYEWSYCEAYGGVSTAWDAQLTLSNYSNSTNLCFSDNVCGTSGNAPYISWTATFTGTVQLLTSQAGCASNSGSPYNKLVWRDASGTASTPVLGLDVSSYQGTINWTQVKAANYTFAWAKSTEGVTVTDSDFNNNMTNGESAGMKMGAYHFAHPETNTASAEATHFLSVAGSFITSCELPPVLDLEDPSSGPSLTSYFTSSQLTTWVQQWMTAVQSATGIAPIIYTNGSIASYLGSSINTYKLWIADPDGSSTAQPTNIGVWSTWAFKQYSWTATVPGISGSSVDLDVFNGTSSALNSLMGCITTGVENHIASTEFAIYPNPATEQVTIENTSPDNQAEGTLTLCNLQGQLLAEVPLQSSKTTLSLSGLPPGLYFISLKTERGTSVKKLVKH